MTVRQQLKAAFAELRKEGYAARINFECCSSCAWYALGAAGKNEQAVFFNRQSNDAFDRDGDLKWDLYLQWAGDVHRIIRALIEAGLTVSWAGTEHAAICVAARPLGGGR